MIGAVYFIRGRASGLIKIGFSTQLRGRLSAIKADAKEPIDLLAHCEGSTSDERVELTRFSPFRVRGEWFTPAPSILARIDEIGLTPVPKQGSRADSYTVQARKWAGFLEDREARQAGATISDARQCVASIVGVSPGTLENLRKGRIAAVSAHLYEALRMRVGAVLAEDIEDAAVQLRAVEDAAIEVQAVETDAVAIRRALGLPS